MNIEHKTRGMVEASMIAVMTSVFVIMGTYIPLLSFILVLIPVPLIILAKRWGMNFSILSSIVATFIIAMMMDPLSAFATMITPTIVANIIGYMIKRKYSPGQIIFGASIGAIVSIALLIQLTSILSGVDVIQMIKSGTEEAMKMSISIYENMNVDKTRIEEMVKTFDLMKEITLILIPSSVIFMGILFTHMNYLVASKVINRIDKEKVQVVLPLRYISLPKNIVMGSFIILLLTYAYSYLKMPNYETLVVNVFIIFRMAFVIQGLGVVSFFMHKYRVSKAFRIIIYTFILLNGSFITILSAIGFVDAVMNIRRIERS